ncbi:MAG: hypothetical protein ACFCU5_14045 [Pleurocapsa sp.]
MAKSIQKTQQELEALKVIVGEAGEELQDLYISYLNLLSQSVKQQIISATYHLCTQIYPESFLKLSLSNKQKIQQKLRELSEQIQPEILNISTERELNFAMQELNLVAEMLKNLRGVPDPPTSGEDRTLPLSSKNETLKEDKVNLELVKAELQELDPTELNIDLENIAENFDNNLDSEELERRQEVDFNNPEHLILWHKQLERNIKKILDQTSKQANRYLQKSGIIPNRLPAKLMEVAMKAEESAARNHGNKIQNVPNILNLIVETDKEKKAQSSSILQISLLRLRLSELEFIDPLLNAKRTQIRNHISKINQLKRQYRDKKREYAQAEAEAAWRSSWYED